MTAKKPSLTKAQRARAIKDHGRKFDWPRQLDAAIKAEYGVEAETTFDIFGMGYVTRWPKGVPKGKSLKISEYIKGFMVCVLRGELQ